MAPDAGNQAAVAASEGSADERPDVAREARDAPVRAVISELAQIPGICAIALCGSRTRGSATPGSDFDLMVFGESPGAIDQSALNAAYRRLGCEEAARKHLAIAELEIGGRKIELFFRTFQHVEAELERAQQGLFRRQFNPLHTLGFISTVLVSYVAYCRPLWDPRGQLRSLMARVAVYPEPLRRRMIEVFVKEARLALIHAAKVRSADDLAYLSGLYARACGALAMVLYAANRRYPIIDKDIHRLAGRLPNAPRDYHERTRTLFRTAAAGELAEARRQAARLLSDVLAIAGNRPAGSAGAKSDRD